MAIMKQLIEYYEGMEAFNLLSTGSTSSVTSAHKDLIFSEEDTLESLYPSLIQSSLSAISIGEDLMFSDEEMLEVLYPPLTPSSSTAASLEEDLISFSDGETASSSHPSTNSTASSQEIRSWEFAVDARLLTPIESTINQPNTSPQSNAYHSSQSPEDSDGRSNKDSNLRTSSLNR